MVFILICSSSYIRNVSSLLFYDVSRKYFSHSVIRIFNESNISIYLSPLFLLGFVLDLENLFLLWW